MREARTRPGATGDAEAPQSADAGDADGGAGTQQQAARAQRAHKRHDAAADAEATAFNERHAGEVAEFNQLTQNACLGEDGKLDPAAVKDWQGAHDVAPDGKVGPKTLAAATGRDPDAKGAASGKQSDAAKSSNPPATSRTRRRAPSTTSSSGSNLGAVQQLLEHLKMLAMAPAGGAGQKSADGGEKQQAGGPDGARHAGADGGLNSKLSVDAFAGAVETLKTKWTDLDPQARGASLVALANDQLTAAGVFPVDGFLDATVTGRVAGKFSNERWKIRLNKSRFSQHKFAADEAPHMAATVYHEARHAEQYFRMAQMMAGQPGTTADAIAASLAVPAPVAAAAMQAKIAPDAPEAKFAQKMFDDRVGKGAAHNAKVLEHVEAEMRDVYLPLLERYEAAEASKDPKAIEEAHKALLQVKQPVMHAWNQYIKLASEADAFAAEHAVDAKLGVAPE